MKGTKPQHKTLSLTMPKKPSLHHLFLLLAAPSTIIDAQTATISLEECPPSQLWRYTLKTDDYPWETSWRLDRIVDNNNSRELAASGPDTNGGYDRRSTYTNSLCLLPGQSYVLTLSDAMGDGFCCSYGRGRWIMTLGEIGSGDEVVVGRVMGAAKFRKLEMQFVVGDGDNGVDNNSGGVSTGGADAGDNGFEWQAAVDETTAVPAVETSAAAAISMGTTSTIASTTTEFESTTTTATPQIITTSDPTAEATGTTVAAAATTTEIAISIEAEADTAAATTNENQAMTTSNSTDEQGTMPPTSSPTSVQELWANYKPSHSKFCGPKIVGGYAIAISQCGPLTMCGLTTNSDHYGANGNDCSKGLMCYSDISCEATPPNGAFDSRMSNHLDDTSNNDNDADLTVVDGRTSGGAKSNEVSLKQDMEVSRVEDSGEFEVDSSLLENSSGVQSARFVHGCLVGVAAAAIGLLLV